MKKIFIYSLTLSSLSSCYTTNDVFIQSPVAPVKSSHEVTVATSLPLIGIPQNASLNYRFSTHELAGTRWNLNCFIRCEKSLKDVLIEDGGFAGNSADYARSDNFKSVLMPSFQIDEDKRLGIGLGLNYVNKIDGGYNVSNMLLPIFSLNYTKIKTNDEEKLNYWNLSLTISDRLNKRDGVNIYSYVDIYDSTKSYYFTDIGSSMICKSLKWSYINENKINVNKLLSFVFKFDIGISYIGDFGKTDNFIDRNIYGDYYYKSYNTINLPIGFSFGLKF